MSYIVALSGGIASGKTTIANLFAQLGVPIIDADVIARQVVAIGTSALTQIVKHFSQEILLANGELDRSQLREIIFNNDHPIIAQETQKQFAEQTAPYVIWVVPLLIENNLQHLADRILLIDTPEELQLERLINRDGISESLANRMIRTQVSLTDRLAFADDIIVNDGNLAALTVQIDHLHKQYLHNSKVKNSYE